jgi:hypothetical protein
VAADRAERLREVLRRLDAAPPCASADEARALLTSTLNDVEDEMAEIPSNPAMPRTDGRMYPPQDDSERAVPGRDDVRRYRSARHNTFIGAAGAIRIEEVRGACVLNKPGQDGQTIELGEPESSRPISPP